MTQPPENGPDAQTQPFGAVPPELQPVVAQPGPEPVLPPAPQPAPAASGSNTRTILEIVGGVVAVVAIFAAGAFGFGLGFFAGSHKDRSNDEMPRMTMRFDDGQGGRGGFGDGEQSAPDLRDFFGGPGDSNGDGTQSMPDLPEDLQKLLEQFGQQFGQERPAPAPSPSS